MVPLNLFVLGLSLVGRIVPSSVSSCTSSSRERSVDLTLRRDSGDMECCVAGSVQSKPLPPSKEPELQLMPAGSKCRGS